MRMVSCKCLGTARNDLCLPVATAFPPSVAHQKSVQDGRILVGPDGWQLPDMQKKDVRLMDTNSEKGHGCIWN